jgi:hypothetical protein
MCLVALFAIGAIQQVEGKQRRATAPTKAKTSTAAPALPPRPVPALPGSSIGQGPNYKKFIRSFKKPMVFGEGIVDQNWISGAAIALRQDGFNTNASIQSALESLLQDYISTSSYRNNPVMVSNILNDMRAKYAQVSFNDTRDLDQEESSEMNARFALKNAITGLTVADIVDARVIKVLVDIAMVLHKVDKDLIPGMIEDTLSADLTFSDRQKRMINDFTQSAMK